MSHIIADIQNRTSISHAQAVRCTGERLVAIKIRYVSEIPWVVPRGTPGNWNPCISTNSNNCWWDRIYRVKENIDVIFFRILSLNVKCWRVATLMRLTNEYVRRLADFWLPSIDNQYINSKDIFLFIIYILYCCIPCTSTGQTRLF